MWVTFSNQLLMRNSDWAGMTVYWQALKESLLKNAVSGRGSEWGLKIISFFTYIFVFWAKNFINIISEPQGTN